jgi:hypothetical protein
LSILLKAMRQLMEGAGDGGAGAGDGGKQKPTPEVFSREYVHELREENKSWRTKHQESEAAKAEALKQVEASTQVAADKIKEGNAAADARVIRAELKAAAVKAGMTDMDFLKLADLSKVKLGDDGEVIGADELMASLKKSKPHWFGEPSSSHPGKPPKPGDQAPKKATDMTPEEFRAEKAKLTRR